VNLTSYAELAVRLVNTNIRADDDHDLLAGPEAFRLLVADRPHLAGPVTRYDLDALRLLRAELGRIFAAAAEGADAAAVERLNALLIQHPVQPVITSHDSGRWHVHLSETGSVADRYAAGAAIGLALLVSQLGVSRLGICAIASCPGVFIDASTNRSRRYCADHCTTRTNVTAIRAGPRTGNTGPAATAAG
jgi:predicted RNA-binding Zn ribbon-like protein